MPALSFKKNSSGPEININLVPQDPFFESILGKTLRWALSIGRYIVIFTELLVILSFVARFTLDRQLTNLNDAIHQKEVVINSYGDLEENVRLTQAKIDQYQQIKQQSNPVEIFPELTRLTPTSIRLDSLTIRSDKITLSGEALTQTALNILINNFQLSSKLSNLNVSKIEAGDQNSRGLSFVITANTNTNQTR